MGTRKVHSWWLIFGVLLTLVLSLATASGQEINLDAFEKCGDLLCYQSLKDLDVYYYLPDQPRLAVKDGRPQFSFLKYARTRETGEAGTGRAEGGGIVHFLVTYGADEARVKGAEKSLQEKYPEAKIAGPVIYRKGSFALITSFKEGEETLTRTVAVGKAPLMEGQKAAVSMALTREGAELLWESFKSATPDISLVFDMIFVGVRQPYEATLEADWQRVSDHHRLKVGMKYAWFGADVDMLFQELRQSGAIKITTKGADANLDKILQSAHTKLLKIMFDPAPVDELTRAAAEKDSYSNLNQAVKLLRDATARPSGRRSDVGPWLRPQVKMILGALRWISPRVSVAEAAEKNLLDQAKEAFNKGEELYHQKKDYARALEWYRRSADLYEQAKGKKSAALMVNMGQCLRKLNRCAEAVEYFREGLASLDKDRDQAIAFAGLGLCLEELNDYTGALAAHRSAAALYGLSSEEGKHASQLAANLAAKVYNEARRLDEAARKAEYETNATHKALVAYQTYLEDGRPTGTRAAEVRGRISFLKRKLGEENSTSAGAGVATGTPSPATSEGAQGSTAATPTAGAQGGKAQGRMAGKKPGTKAAKPSSRKPSTFRKKSPAAQSRKKGTPGFSLVASYRMKKIKRSGRMVYHMNHYRSESQAFAMAENIGDLYRRYGSDTRIFRAVNIDDPVFKQREILVTLDGQDASTFGKHMNFVTVQMKKIHESGEVSTDEVVITPERFNQSSNAFVLSYGWKGDDDRTAWLQYTVQTLWSFHGGVRIRTRWNTHNGAMLALQPPHRYRSITVEGEGDRLTKARVRHAVITVTSQVGGKSVVTKGTIRNRGPAPALVLEVPEDREGPPCEVSITWHLEGGETVISPARSVEGDIVYWDELPEKEV
jgi:tetratricopeptide (TPR) repeat protein